MNSLIGILFGLLTAFSKSASDLMSKYSLDDDINEYVTGWALRFFAIPFLLVPLFFRGVPEIEQEFYVSLVISGSISIVATVLIMKAYNLTDISLIAPVYSASPILLLITSPLIVNEFPSPMGLLGVLLILVGVYVTKIKEVKYGYLKPIKATVSDKGMQYIMVVLVLYSISSNVDKIATQASSPLFYSVALQAFSAAGLTPLMILKADDWKSTIREDYKKIIPVGLLNGLASVFFLTAFTYTLVIYVTALKRASTITTVIGGSLLLNEGGLRQRLLGAVIVVIGVIVIGLALS